MSNNMESNNKLTSVIKGRTISGTQNQDDKLTISFTDGSHLIVKTAGSSNSASTGGTIKAVRQAGTTLNLDMEDGATFSITSAETSSIIVRDKSDTTEYAD